MGSAGGAVGGFQPGVGSAMASSSVQVPDEFASTGFAEPPQRQSPEQPATSTKGSAQCRPPMRSPSQHARWPLPPHVVVLTQVLFELMLELLLPPHKQATSQPLISVNPVAHGAPSPVIAQQPRWPSPPHGLCARTTQ